MSSFILFKILIYIFKIIKYILKIVINQIIYIYDIFYKTIIIKHNLKY
jgi:hypothetical protein